MARAVWRNGEMSCRCSKEPSAAMSALLLLVVGPQADNQNNAH